MQKVFLGAKSRLCANQVYLPMYTDFVISFCPVSQL